MSLRALLVALALAAPVDAPASAGPRAGLTVWPARVRVGPGAADTIHDANASGRVQVLAARVAGFALDVRGTPRVVGTSAGTPLLRVRPAQAVVPPGATASFSVSATAARPGRPGDRPALVLLTARTAGGAGVGVRLRIGVSVEVRLPGRVQRRLAVLSVRKRHGRALDVLVENRGDVAERVVHGVVVLRVRRRGRVVAILQPRSRELLPRSRGIVEFVVPRRLRGRVTVIAVAPRLGGAGRSVSVKT